MVSIHALWFPILLSAVIVFVASSILHMLIPIHKGDYRQLPDEEKVTDALRAAGVTPGRMYTFPFCTHRDMKSPAVIEKFKRGPVGHVIIRPNGARFRQIPRPVVSVLHRRQHFCGVPDRAHATRRHRLP
ncbi:MAG TPA: hypothetical protein VF447_10345 [Terriglobales bacterium]